ncbi:FAD binding domain-containing protein, partial [Chloroflexota bacterium]
LPELEGVLGDVQTRNWGTAVGNICMSSPTSDLSPSLTALKASFKVKSARGERLISVDDFFVAYMKTALEVDEMIVEIQIPKPPVHTGSAYHKERVRMTDSPIASVAAAVTLNDACDTITAARVVLQAVCPTPLRATQSEELLIGAKVGGDFLPAALAAVADTACPISDIYGSIEYKKAMAQVAAKKVIERAIERAKIS